MNTLLETILAMTLSLDCVVLAGAAKDTPARGRRT
jgi:hypothetical protein